MLTSKRMLVSLVLAAILVNLLSAQHWSFNIRPGGKREAAVDVIDSFQDTAGNVERLLQSEHLIPDCSRRTKAKFIPERKKLWSECQQVTVR